MIYLLRHGLDDENYIGGWSDVDLIPEGIDQVNKTLDQMLKQNIEIQHVIASDVKRAITTAELVLEKYNDIKTYEISTMFREQSKGLLNGMPVELRDRDYPEYKGTEVQIDTVYPEGESLLDLYKRMKECLNDILALEDNTLIVTHRGVINMLYFILNNQELDMDKKQFGVTHASLHELDKKTLSIRKVI